MPRPRYRHGIEQREPYESELGFFLRNPGVAGMAAEDNRVTLNPFSLNSPEEQRAVAENEATRVHMRTNPDLAPRFDPTAEQAQRFGAYGSPDDIRQTIAARLFSGDPSAGAASPAQVGFIDKLRRHLGGKN
jgi:hypothetical protein